MAKELTAYAQNTKADTDIANYLAAVDSAFVQDDSTHFNQLVYPGEIQNYYAELLNKKVSRKAGNHRILKVYTDSAFVLLTGMVSVGNSGDETNSALHYSGIYRLKKISGKWQLQNHIAFDRLNQISTQHIDLVIKPGEGMAIQDTLTINSNDELGFVMRLNHRADIHTVLLNGKVIPYLFDGGLLWISSSLKRKQQLILCYSLQVENNMKDVNSAYFGNTYGHVRNQYCWHPFFSYSSANDRANFVVHCRLPKEYPLSTSLPQTDHIRGNLRFVEARSENPTFALALYYDKDWLVSYHQKGKTKLVIYATPDFEPSRDTLYKYFSDASNLLSARFGEAKSTYLGIVQDRSGGGNGWKNRSNSTIIASAKGSYLIVNTPRPRAVFGHEVAHGWTTPSGEAANLLSEGWATYCESYLLANRYTDTIVKPFFASQRSNYLNGGYNGKVNLNNDYSNSGVSYGKGAWLFYMLEQQLGKERFNAALRMFIRSNNQNINIFIQSVSKAAGKDMAPFIRPWLNNKTIPVLSIRQNGQYLIVKQTGDLFRFPLTIRLKFKNGTSVDKTIWVDSMEQRLEIPGTGLENYEVDPEQQVLFLLKNS